MAVGILCREEVETELIPAPPGRHRIHRPSGSSIAAGLSAVDLPLGNKYWVMRGSCRSGPDLNVSDLHRLYAQGEPREKELVHGTVLEKQKVYLIQLDCGVDLSETRIRGKSTGRSSIGRLDVLVRLLADVSGSYEFDVLPENARGDLYVEVAPMSFGLEVNQGTCLSQLRLYRGPEDLFTLTMDELAYEEPFPVVNRHGEPQRQGCEHRERETTFPFCLDLSPDPEHECSAFVAKENPPAAVDPDKKDHYDPKDFWEPVRLKPGDPLDLRTNRLYILRSKERLHLQGNLAVECQTYTETLGEWRIEYAGFAHPWFGSTREEGTPIIFEVRGHNIPTILRDGLQLGKVMFRRMSRVTQSSDENPQYEKQELKLSSCFKPWA